MNWLKDVVVELCLAMHYKLMILGIEMGVGAPQKQFVRLLLVM